MEGGGERARRGDARGARLGLNSSLSEEENVFGSTDNPVDDRRRKWRIHETLARRSCGEYNVEFIKFK